MGVAIATSHGLAVPNVKNVQRLSVLEVKELFFFVVIYACDLKLQE